MRIPAQIATLALAFATSAIAAPSADQLAEVATFGGLAATAPLCGLRDESWAADLRRAALQSVAGVPASRDANLAAAALGHGDMEALEDFAGRAPEASCEKIRTDPALPRADAMVGAFRGGKPGS
jgi:hypothetical protein